MQKKAKEKRTRHHRRRRRVLENRVEWGWGVGVWAGLRGRGRMGVANNDNERHLVSDWGWVGGGGWTRRRLGPFWSSHVRVSIHRRKARPEKKRRKKQKNDAEYGPARANGRTSTVFVSSSSFRRLLAVLLRRTFGSRRFRFFCLRQDGDAAARDVDVVHAGRALEVGTQQVGGQFVLADARHGLEFGRLVFGERLGRKVHVVGLGQRPQVEVVLGVHRRRDVDVELQHLQKVPLQLVPATTTTRTTTSSETPQQHTGGRRRTCLRR